MNTHPGVAAALIAGCKLHSFRSGGGLRVVRLENRTGLRGYGEHPHIEDALKHAGEDFEAGGLPYEKVYGQGKKYPHYLTGSPEPSSELDAWVLRAARLQQTHR